MATTKPLKIGAKVVACPVSKQDRQVHGKIAAFHYTQKGVFVEIKPADKLQRNFKTRPALVRAA